MKAFIYPYKPGSESAKALSDGLGLLRIAHKNSKFKGHKDKLVINWGASKVSEEVAKCTILNLPQAVAEASDKLKAFKRMNEGKRAHRTVKVAGNTHKLPLNHEVFRLVSDDFVGKIQDPRYGEIDVLEPVPAEALFCRTPDYTNDMMIARAWHIGGATIVERHILNGNSGAGIRLVEPGDEEGITRAPLYVKYVPKKQEYRIHVCGGEAVDIQRKARRKDVADEDINWKIRNHDNGFIFARGEELGVTPEDVIKQAVSAVKSLGLAFGAVDVIFNEKEQRAYVLEVNTAPGLSGTTLDGYLARFTEYLKGNVELPPQVIPAEFIGEEEENLVDLPGLAGFKAMVFDDVMAPIGRVAKAPRPKAGAAPQPDWAP